MSRDTEWGTEMEIMVAAALFKVFIIVQANQADRSFYLGDPRNPPIFIFNDSLRHYEWMKRN
jgi:hypothetical protein